MKSSKFTFIAIFILLTPIISITSNAEENTLANYASIEFVGDATQVQIIGEWDWSNPLDLMKNGTIWSIDLQVDEGIYCYKFIVDGEYIFDPNNPERGYCDNIENSLLRVRDNSRPSFTAQLNDNNLEIFYHAGSGGFDFSGTPNAIEGAPWNETTKSWKYDITTLSDGKHSLLIEGQDLNGNLAYDLLVPFWTGNQSDFIWDDALIYMIMTDRFVNGNSSNDGDVTNAVHGADWQGGDFEGVTQMIESGYFAELGVNALWLTPFNEAASGTGEAADGIHDVSAFHGYWPTEARSIEPRLGTEEQLHEMVNAAHDNGIRIMMDFVVNHVHEQHHYYQDNPEWFNSGCICGTTNCDWTDYRLECQFTSYMPDLNWKNRNASEQFIEDAIWWIETFDLDGARVDAVKHVDDLAVRNLVAQINERFETVGTDYYLKGETAMGWSGHSLEANQEQYGTINSYMGPDGLDGQADFVLYHAVVDNVFVSGNEGYQHLDFWTNRSQDQYLQGSIMVPYVGSHDVPRITSRADSGTSDAYNQWLENGLPGQPGDESAYNSTLQAYGWLLTTPGAPLLYYGDEYGEFGGADPDNRHMYREQSQWSSYESELFEKISEIGKIRLESDALRRGQYSTIHAEPDRLVYSMKSDNQEINIILNRGGEWSWRGFDESYEVRYGEPIINSDEIIVPKNSILIIEINSTHQNVSTEILGCMDILATNYNSNATNDDGSCNYETDNSNATNENNQTQTIYGCMDIDAINFNNEATNNDSSCKYKENEEANKAQSSDEDNSLGYYIRTALFLGIIAAGLILIFMNRKN